MVGDRLATGCRLWCQRELTLRLVGLEMARTGLSYRKIAIKMMIGMGMPRNRRRSERMVASVEE